MLRFAIVLIAAVMMSGNVFPSPTVINRAIEAAKRQIHSAPLSFPPIEPLRIRTIVPAVAPPSRDFFRRWGPSDTDPQGCWNLPPRPYSGHGFPFRQAYVVCPDGSVS